jgi:hypothetical protein
MFCCKRSKPTPAPAPAPVFDQSTCPLNHCEWCENDLDTCVAYNLHVLDYETKLSRIYRLGQCCVDSGRLGDYVSDFVVRWGVDANDDLDPIATHWNVTQMFEEARARHYGHDREGARAMFRAAWRTFKKLTAEEQKLVAK